MADVLSQSEVESLLAALDTGAAERAIAALGNRLGLRIEEIAWGIHKVVT